MYCGKITIEYLVIYKPSFKRVLIFYKEVKEKVKEKVKG